MNDIPSPIPNFKIRFAKETDADIILMFIHALATYEKMEDQVIATKEKIIDSLFVKKQAEVIIGEENNKPIAFSLFYPNYSTFLGQANMFLEDLYVLESHRNKGFGKLMLSALATIAVERGYKRLDWMCLNWNHPSIEFYKKIGATSLDDWLIFRLKDKKIEVLSQYLSKKITP